MYPTRPAQMKNGCGLHNGSVGAGCASTLAVVVIVQVVLECVSDANHSRHSHQDGSERNGRVVVGVGVHHVAIRGFLFLVWCSFVAC